MGSAVHVRVIWHRAAEFHSATINIGTSVEIEITHPLQQIPDVAFVRLKDVPHDCALPQKVGQASHVEGIQHVDFEKEVVADVVAIERHPLDEIDVRNEWSLFVGYGTAVADGKSVVYRQVKLTKVTID